MDIPLPNHQKVSLHYAIFENQQEGVFPIKGQGTVSVSPKVIDKELRIMLSTADGDCVGLTVSKEKAQLWMKKVGGTETSLKESTDPKHLLDNVAQPYWMSLDTINQCLRYGKGEMLSQLVLREHTWADSEIEFSKDIQDIRIAGTQIDRMRIMNVPVTLSPSPYIIPSSQVTMEIIANNSASVIDSLPPACKRLYASVSGPGINLAPLDFPEFAQAIQHSIVTPGALCHQKLREKMQKNPEFGYLRVTLESNAGDSPGQPYVLEIWPAGHRSPIHRHGNACAVIKVLHGQIKISWFSALSPQISEPWGSTIAHAGDITFLTPDYYQTHQLLNPSPKGGSFCATIQCYRYPDDDSEHYSDFDFIEDGKVVHHPPVPDWTYLDFKKAIQKEWIQAMNGGEK